jgi:hypothetical protein
MNVSLSFNNMFKQEDPMNIKILLGTLSMFWPTNSRAKDAPFLT